MAPRVDETPVPEYTVFYRRQEIHVTDSGPEAMSRVDPLDPNYTVWVEVGDKSWRCWPSAEEVAA